MPSTLMRTITCLLTTEPASTLPATAKYFRTHRARCWTAVFARSYNPFNLSDTTIPSKAFGLPSVTAELNCVKRTWPSKYKLWKKIKPDSLAHFLSQPLLNPRINFWLSVLFISLDPLILFIFIRHNANVNVKNHQSKKKPKSSTASLTL